MVITCTNLFPSTGSDYYKIHTARTDTSAAKTDGNTAKAQVLSTAEEMP